MIVCSTVDPLPNFAVIDKMTAAAVNNGMQPVIAVSKNDIKNGDEIADIYRGSGIEVFQLSPDSREEADALLSLLRGKVSAFTGNSGVGKSTLLNMLFPGLELATGEISDKLGRGRHTTRVVELFEENGCLVADTPGFSTVDLQRYGCSTASPSLRNISDSVSSRPARTPVKRAAQSSRRYARAGSTRPATKATSPCTTRSRISSRGSLSDSDEMLHNRGRAVARH